MLQKMGLVGVLVSAGLLVGCAEGGLMVRVAPPAPIIESYGSAPGPGYVWQPGYQRWDGRGYVWAPGHWERVPRARARWIAPHWQQRRGGWVFVEGRWR